MHFKATAARLSEIPDVLIQDVAELKRPSDLKKKYKVLDHAAQDNGRLLIL